MPQVTLRYSEKLLRAALAAYFLLVVLPRIGWVAGIALTIMCVWLGYLLLKGETGWLTVFMLVIVLLSFLLLMIVGLAHYHNTMGLFRSMKMPEGVFEYGENSFTIRSDLGSGALPWSRVTGIVRRPDFWLLLLHPSQFITLPLAGFSSQDLAFIESKIGKKAS